MTLSQEALELRARTEAEAGGRRRDIWDGKRPMAQGARTLGSLALVTPGVAVWTDLDRKRGPHDEALGGIVLEILHHDVTDADTGEIKDIKSFRTYDSLVRFPSESFRVFAEDLICQDGVEAVDSSSLATAVRRFCRHVGAGRGLLVGYDAQLIADAHHLALVCMGGTL